MSATLVAARHFGVSDARCCWGERSESSWDRRSGLGNLPSAAGLCCTFIGVPIILGVRRIVEKIEPVEY